MATQDPPALWGEATARPISLGHTMSRRNGRSVGYTNCFPIMVHVCLSDFDQSAMDGTAARMMDICAVQRALRRHRLTMTCRLPKAQRRATHGADVPAHTATLD